MSDFERVLDHLKNAFFDGVNEQKYAYMPDRSGHFFVTSDTKPTDGTAGYAPGAVWFKIGATTVGSAININVGSATSCNFDPLT